MKNFYLFLISILFASGLLANNKLPQTGLASYYSDGTNHHRTACWDWYCKDSFTAAHRTLPFGTYLKVTNLKNNKVVIVRINDRGPHRRRRIIDLSGAAANAIDMKRAGLAKVTIDLASPEEIESFKRKYIDSLFPAPTFVHDSCSAFNIAKTANIFRDEEKFMIQGGVFKTQKNADWIKKYLTDNCVGHVAVKCKKTRRHKTFRVLIGPLNTEEKENALKVLKNKGISGWVIRS